MVSFPKSLKLHFTSLLSNNTVKVSLAPTGALWISNVLSLYKVETISLVPGLIFIVLFLSQKPEAKFLDFFLIKLETVLVL